MEKVFNENNVAVASAILWMECVGASLNAVKTISPERVLTVSYEQFTNSPSHEIERIAEHF